MWVILCALLSAVAAILAAKILLLKKSVREIGEGLRQKLADDTNTRIDVASGDKDVRQLAARINRQLEILRDQKRKYLSGDRELKEAVTNISHDLRTPLTAICGYMQLLEKEEKSPKAEEYLRIIAARIVSLKSLTEELFKYSVITSVEQGESEMLSVKEALENALLGFYGVFAEKGMAVKADITDERVEKVLSKGALTRIFGNILSNAVKYSAGDITVTMTADCTISFSNPAPGLDEVTTGKLFDRFFTVESGRNSTGLGLSIARILTERMHGTIDAAYRNGELVIVVKF